MKNHITEDINLFILNLTLTLRCTLNCKLCVADVPKYSVSPHWTKEFLYGAIDKCFAIINRVERFQLSGGEPLLHKDFVEILQRAMQYSDRFTFLGIFSNGAIVPSGKIIDLIKNFPQEKIKFYISDYGGLSPKTDNIKKLLTNESIPFEVKTYFGKNQHFDGWIDYGEYAYQGYSPEHFREVFSNCAVSKIGGIWSCRYGQLHRCTRSASGMDLKAIPESPSEYLDLFADCSISDQKEKLRKIMDLPYLTACLYCTGDFGTNNKQKRYPAAEQIKK
ncbi:MAG: radical SAM protein [Synergistaceae bacterium]|nr:radical SAM protein [Synergistaceae bacterium]